MMMMRAMTYFRVVSHFKLTQKKNFNLNESNCTYLLIQSFWKACSIYLHAIGAAIMDHRISYVIAHFAHPMNEFHDIVRQM